MGPIFLGPGRLQGVEALAQLFVATGKRLASVDISSNLEYVPRLVAILLSQLLVHECHKQ
jgi:hypothetical protein